MRKRIYSKNMERFLEKRQYIPRHLSSDEHLKIFKRYYCSYYDTYFKVDNIFYIDDKEYYNVRYLNSLYGIFDYDSNEYLYEFMIDKNNIAELDNIINTNISYTGAEIRYWFFVNGDKLSNAQYNRFYKFIGFNKHSSINDNKRYYLNYRNGTATVIAED